MEIYWAQSDMIDIVLLIVNFPSLLKHVYDTKPLNHEFGESLVEHYPDVHR